MATFAYAARDRTGRALRGSLEAPTPAAAAADLRNRGWVVVQIRPESARASRSGSGGVSWLPIRSSDIEVSLRQLAVMLRSGLTLLNALQTVAEQSPRPAMRRIWTDVSRRIQEGSGLGEAMAVHPQFSALVVQLVRVGEQTGHLEEVLVRAASGLEQRRKLRSQLISALAYPGIVLAAAIGVTMFMMVSVIPKLQQFLGTMGRRLPPMTQLLVDVSTFIQTYWLQGLVIGVLLSGVIVGLRSWPPSRFWMDRRLVRVPVIGILNRLAGTVLMARGLSTLLRSGVTLLESLRTVERLIGNRYLASRVAQARDAVLQGGALAAPLAAEPAFMPMLAGMVAVGESAGTLDEVLEEVARFYEEELQRAIQRLAALVEPAIILFVGGIVGFVYIAFFMALFAAAG
jgi:type II secretory pathway component PulF